MIGKIKDKKYKVILAFFAFTLIIIYVLFGDYIKGFIVFINVGMEEARENNIAEKYKSDNDRLNYYKQNKSYLNDLSEILKEYDSIYEISTNNICSDYMYSYKDVIICSREKIYNLPIDEISYNFSKLELNSVYKLNFNKILFRKVNTPEYRVIFNYCIDVNMCYNKNELIEKEYGRIEEKIINEHWSSYFSDIPLS